MSKPVASSTENAKLIERLRALYGTHPVVMEAANELETWERRWDRIRWCYQGCGEDRSVPSGPTIGIGGGGIFG